MIQKSGIILKKVVQEIMGAVIIFFGFSSDKSNLISEHQGVVVFSES